MVNLSSKWIRIGAGAVLSFALLGSPAAAYSQSEGAEAGGSHPAALPITATAETTSDSCIEQIEAIAAEKGVSPGPGLGLCTATVVTSESEPQIATVSDMKAYAEVEGLSRAQADTLVARAATGSIKYRNWTHSYWGGSLLEKHSGRTYWDGSKAWIAKYRGYTGSHACHTEGGIAVGWAVEPLSCSKPGAGAWADAVYLFDASVFFKGSPITMTVGLHYSTSGTGSTSTWQVGG